MLMFFINKCIAIKTISHDEFLLTTLPCFFYTIGARDHSRFSTLGL